MFDITRLFDLGYLFHPNPGKYFPLGNWILGFFVLLLIVAIAIFIVQHMVKLNPVLKRILRKTPMYLFWFAIGGFVLIFMRLGEASYLSMRLWLVIWGALFIWYLTTLVLQFQRYPKDLAEFQGKMHRKAEAQSVPDWMKKKKKKS